MLDHHCERHGGQTDNPDYDRYVPEALEWHHQGGKGANDLSDLNNPNTDGNFASTPEPSRSTTIGEPELAIL